VTDEEGLLAKYQAVADAAAAVLQGTSWHELLGTVTRASMLSSSAQYLPRLRDALAALDKARSLLTTRTPEQ
jgi:hypothetical protein